MADTLWCAVADDNPRAQFPGRDREHAEQIAARATALPGMRGSYHAAEWQGEPAVHAAFLRALPRLFGTGEAAQ